MYLARAHTIILILIQESYISVCEGDNVRQNAIHYRSLVTNPQANKPRVLNARILDALSIDLVSYPFRPAYIVPMSSK
jgi:hypothetical protein